VCHLVKMTVDADANIPVPLLFGGCGYCTEDDVFRFHAEHHSTVLCLGDG